MAKSTATSAASGAPGRLDQLGRDLRALLDGFRGRGPAPFRPRTARVRLTSTPVAAPAALALATRRLRVDRVDRETADAITVHLADPTGARIDYLPGQFFTLLVDVGGERLRRAYSACQPAGTDGPASVAVTIKRIAGGRVSNHLNEQLCAGDELDVLGPSGSFSPAARAAGDAARELVLLGGGSGITPLMAIARATLAAESDARVTLVYGNRRAEDIIFRAALDALAVAHGERLTLRHVLAEPPAAWSGGTGLLDAATCAWELDALPRPAAHAEYFVCGPAPMMDAARAALLARGVPADAIHEERFASPVGASAADTAAASAQAVRVRLAGRVHEVIAQPGQTLLDAGLAAGVAMPYSCTLGGCGACKVKLVDGTTAAVEDGCLSPAERAGGYVLACSTRPTSACTVEVEK